MRAPSPKSGNSGGPDGGSVLGRSRTGSDSPNAAGDVTTGCVATPAVAVELAPLDRVAACEPLGGNANTPMANANMRIFGRGPHLFIQRSFVQCRVGRRFLITARERAGFRASLTAPSPQEIAWLSRIVPHRPNQPGPASSPMRDRDRKSNFS